MSILQKGVLTVISATVVASALIMFWGDNVTAEADHAAHSVSASDVVNERLGNNVLTENSSTLQEKVLLKKSSGDEQLQHQRHEVKPPLPANPLSPPPIGPFQVAQPTVMVTPDQKSQAPTSPMIKKMNQQAAQSPKLLPSQQLRPEVQANKFIVPVNRLVKPQAPMLKTPELFASPPAAPIMQRYMYVPAPFEMYPLLPQMPVAGAYMVAPPISKVPASGVVQKESGMLRNDMQQPTLQPNK